MLVDENEAINQGAYIYPCRFVLVRKRNGRYKARWVLRGDHQIFDEPDLDDDEDDLENDSPVNDDYNAEVTEEEDKAVVQEATENDTVVDAFNTAFAGLSEKVKNTYRQLFSPALTTMSLMVLFATATANDRTLFLADVTGAFLLASLLREEVVFARPPKGCENHPELKDTILHLVKSLYGLK